MKKIFQPVVAGSQWNAYDFQRLYLQCTFFVHTEKAHNFVNDQKFMIDFMSIAGSNQKDFIYSGQRREDIPNVPHVKVDPTIKATPKKAFIRCYQLSAMQLS